MTQDLLPPEEMNFVGDGDFTAVGEHFFEHFVNIGGLKPNHRVLDVGSGIGRMALPMTKYLTTGSYEGFDIVDVGVNWCQHHITPKCPNFRFQVADVFNRGYNPTGRYLASEYRFPYADASFDFVFLTSVFTHMMPDEVQNYLHEISRVLVPGGRCMATFFLNNPETIELMKQGKTHLKFATEWKKDCWVANPNLPEDAVCFTENYVVRQYERAGMTADHVYHGAWTGRSNTLTAHDVILSTKSARTMQPKALVAPRMTFARLWHGLWQPIRREILGKGMWHGATESGVTRARAYASLHPEVMETKD